jgi:DNA polymerase-3 subunit beta
MKMEFIIAKDTLVDSLSAVEKFVPSKSSISLLMGIKFFCINNTLYLSATDLEMGIEQKISGENLHIIKEGSAVIPAKVLSEITKKLPSGSVEFSIKENRVNITSGDFAMELPFYDALDFPEISKKECVSRIKFSQATFKNLIKQTIFAKADDTTSRPQLTGILIELKGKKFNMVALDGYRIAWCFEEIEETPKSEENMSIIVPGRTMSELARIFSDEEDDEFAIYSGKNRVEFRTNDIVISSRILEGNFIDYEKVMCIQDKTRVNIEVDALLGAIERAYIMAREGNKNNLIKFFISKDTIEVSADTELGNINDKLLCNTSGDELLIAFNARFLIDALRTIESTHVNLFFSGETGPVIIKPVDKENQINFILPVKLRGDDF